MKLYLAPMEGLTGYVFRNVFHRYYGAADRYFTPFVSHAGLTARERQDVLPQHNQDLDTVPQILTNRADVFLSLARELADMGYQEVNLNLGCPSGTVVKKNRGAGMLADLSALEVFLTEIYEKTPVKVSIKTRIGMEQESEWPEILEIYKKFPVSELIVHPRVQKDLYKKPVRPEAFQLAAEALGDQIPLCFSGDVLTPEGFLRFQKAFPKAPALMLGRGILRNPELLSEIRLLLEKQNREDAGSAGTCSEGGAGGSGIPPYLAVEDEILPIRDRERFRKFHAALLEQYRQTMDGDRNVLFKMKELWFYLGQSFPYAKKELKIIKKTQSLQEYRGAVSAILGR